MFTTAPDRLLVFLPTGLGLLAVGVVFLHQHRFKCAVRVALVVGIALIVAGGLAALNEPAPAVLAGVLTLALASFAAIIGTDWLAVVAAWVRRPVVRWAAVAIVGLATALGSLAQYEYESSDLDTSDLAENLLSQDLAGVPGSALLTDRGTVVVAKRPVNLAPPDALARSDDRMFNEKGWALYMIRRQPAFQEANCHGWVFAAGRYWIGGNSVASILEDNLYKPTETPWPGDAIVYRTNGSVTHSGVVRYVTPGQPVMVESKWGRLGVYLHAADQSCYGAEFTYYRSSREGHTLNGATGG